MPRVYHSGGICCLFMLLDSKVDLSIFVVYSYNGNTCRLIECQFCVHSMVPYVRICLSSRLIATEYSFRAFCRGPGGGGHRWRTNFSYCNFFYEATPCFTGLLLFVFLLIMLLKWVYVTLKYACIFIRSRPSGLPMSGCIVLPQTF
jgi:hypothetical protein